MKVSLHASTIFLSGALWVFGCSKTEDPVEWYPSEVCDTSFKVNRFPLPPAKSYDLNGDGIDDIEISQRTISFNEGTEDARIFNSILPLGANEVLTNGPGGAGYLEINDTVEFGRGRMIWYRHGKTLLSVTGCQGLFQANWRLMRGDRKNEFHCAKVRHKGQLHMAWFEVEFDFPNGEIEVIDSDFKVDSSIVVGVHY